MVACRLPAARSPALPFFLERYAEAYRAELDAFVAAILDLSLIHI